MNRKKAFWRGFYAYSRLLHVYISSCLFSLLVMFCITGVVLNHLHWLEGTSKDGSVVLALPEEVQQLAPEVLVQEPPLKLLQQYLTAQMGLPKRADVHLDAEFGELSLDYKLPAGYATAFWEFGSDDITVDFRKGGFWEVLGDLHKGRHTGAVWSWVIDLSGVLMCLFALTGMVILWQNKKHRHLGLSLFIAGSVSPLLLYFLWVPKLTE